MDATDLPRRMFAEGDEPVGVSVTAYHKPRAIENVVNALDADEVESLHNSPFGKLLDLHLKPRFSGSFLRFVMSRQLKVHKNREIWFLYSARPIPFSLREFAIVTGLQCGPYPNVSKKKLKNKIVEESNWAALFGTLKSVTIDTVIKMLKKRTVTDKEMRLKYAYLAILDSVIMPTGHHHKIDAKHAEAIKDTNEFFSYPWGRAGFELLLKSINERDELSLSQETLAIKGFVHAIQLVLLEAVLAISECLQVAASSSSDSDDEDSYSAETEAKQCILKINTGHARTVHDNATAIVDSIIPDDDEAPIDEATCVFIDELKDSLVDNMLKLISEEYEFANKDFIGGATLADVARMRVEAAAKKENDRSNKNKGVPLMRGYLTNHNQLTQH